MNQVKVVARKKEQKTKEGDRGKRGGKRKNKSGKIRDSVRLLWGFGNVRKLVQEGDRFCATGRKQIVGERGGRG